MSTITTQPPRDKAQEPPPIPKIPDTGSNVPLLTHIRRDEIEPDVRPLDLGMYKRMFRYGLAYKGFLYPLLMLVVIRAFQLPLLNKVFASILNGPIPAGDMKWLVLAVLGYLGLCVLTQFTLLWRVALAQLLGEGIVHDLRRDIFDKLQTLTMAFFHKTRLGRIISRITSDSEVVRVGVQDAVFVTIVGMGQAIVALSIMASSDRPLFWVILGTTPGYYVIYRYFRTRLTRAHRANQESFSRLTATLAESVTGIRVTQGYVRQDLNARLWYGLVRDHQGYNMNTVRQAGFFGPTLELVNALVISGIFIIGGYRVLNPLIGAKLEHVITFYFLIGDVLTPIVSLSNNYTQAIAAMAGGERIFNLLDRKPDFVDDPSAAAPPAIQGRVEFRDLWFEYDPGKPVLKDINVVVEPGQTIALVGHTGSGKSSIINLISKFYLPTRGELLIDGVDIRKIQADSLHHQMGIVLQQNFLFTGTVIENIRMGRLDATDDEVKEAARKLDVLDLIEAMPDGFNSKVGERGAGLSLGERQVICFCRAMLANPKIMILDEATSSVDTLTEIRLQKALAILLKGRTSFVVAHRLSTIRHADLLLVLDQGRIIERGTHEMLLADGGTYSNLYRQFIRAGEA